MPDLPARTLRIEPSTIDGAPSLVPAVFRSVRPAEEFGGFDQKYQDQPFKTLQYAPALVVFGMDPDGVPQALFASKFLATGLKWQPQPLIELATQPVGVQPLVFTVAADEEALVQTVNTTVTTAGGGPARRVYLVSNEPGKEIGEIEGVATISQSGGATTTYFGSKTFGFSPVAELTLPEGGFVIRPGASVFIFIDAIGGSDFVRSAEFGVSTRKVS